MSLSTGAPHKLSILFFGGTGFVGRAAVAEGLARGHACTLVCRGLSDPDAFPGVRRILGERTDARTLEHLAAGGFDAVIDSSAYLPREVRTALRAIGEPPPHYVFVSSISVYAKSDAPLNESSPRANPIEGNDAVLTVESYAGLKVACEDALAAYAERATVVRPGRILGPFDSDPRAPWFLRRVARGGQMVAAGDPEAPVQLVDARDLARFMLDCVENKRFGTYNAVCAPFTSRELHETAREVTGADTRFIWVPDEVLLAHAVVPFREAPFWLPRVAYSVMRADASKAVAEGLRCRPLRETLADEWAWMKTGWDRAEGVRTQNKIKLEAGISDEKERAISRLT